MMKKWNQEFHGGSVGLRIRHYPCCAAGLIPAPGKFHMLWVQKKKRCWENKSIRDFVNHKMRTGLGDPPGTENPSISAQIGKWKGLHCR